MFGYVRLCSTAMNRDVGLCTAMFTVMNGDVGECSAMFYGNERGCWGMNGDEWMGTLLKVHRRMGTYDGHAAGHVHRARELLGRPLRADS